MYAYQLSNPNWLEGSEFLGAWDVAISGHSGYLSIPLRQLHVIPVDFDGDNALDTSFRLTDHACSAEIAANGNDCAPLTGPFSLFTTGLNPCAYSWSDYYITYNGGPGYPDGVSNDEIIEALAFNDGGQERANFAVEFDPLCCAHGIFASTQIFGFVTDAPPGTVDGPFLGGTTSNVRVVAPAPRALLVHGFCDDTSIWNTFEPVLADSGFTVERLV